MTEKHPTQGSVSEWCELKTSSGLGLSPGVVPVTLQSTDCVTSKQIAIRQPLHSWESELNCTYIVYWWLVSDGFLAEPDSSDFGTKILEFSKLFFLNPSVILLCHTLFLLEVTN